MKHPSHLLIRTTFTFTFTGAGHVLIERNRISVGIDPRQAGRAGGCFIRPHYSLAESELFGLTVFQW
jgi:hypothetical protein